MDLRSLMRIAGRGPDIVQLLNAARSAAEGDPTAQAYIREQGIFQALDIVRDGAGHAARGIVAGVQELRHGGDVIEGEFQELDEPWRDAVTHIKAMKWGVILICGDKGEGKSELGYKLCDIFNREHGYKIELVNVWKDEMPPALQGRASTVPMKRLQERMELVSRYLDQAESGLDDEVDDGIEHKPDPKSEPVQEWQIKKLCHRVIFIDEIGMALSALAAGGQQAARAATSNLDNQIRHLQSILILSLQQQRQAPGYLHDAAVSFFKRPNPDLERLDEIDGRRSLANERWAEAKAALATVPQNWWYQPPFDDLRAWAYMRSHHLGGHGYFGLMPFTRVGTGQPVTETEPDDEANE